MTRNQMVLVKDWEDYSILPSDQVKLDPANTNAKYSLGVFFFNKGADANNEANTFDFNDPQHNAKYDAKIAESKAHFKRAVEFLQNAEKKKVQTDQLKTGNARFGTKNAWYWTRRPWYQIGRI